VAVDVAAFQRGPPGGRRVEAGRAVGEEHLLAADDRPVEVDDGVAPPHRADQVAGIDDQAGLLGQFARRGVA
jgi:hypothetical protein